MRSCSAGSMPTTTLGPPMIQTRSAPCSPTTPSTGGILGTSETMWLAAAPRSLLAGEPRRSRDVPWCVPPVASTGRRGDRGGDDVLLYRCDPGDTRPCLSQPVGAALQRCGAVSLVHRVVHASTRHTIACRALG